MFIINSQSSISLANKTCLFANFIPLVCTFLMVLKSSNVPKTDSTVAERNFFIFHPIGEC